jgi:hypothetical protein
MIEMLEVSRGKKIEDLEVLDRDDESIPGNADMTALELLRSVYQNPTLALSVRMRAASIAIPYESPKLAVTAVISDDDFAARLDQRLRRIAERKYMEAKPMIEARPIEKGAPLAKEEGTPKRVTEPKVIDHSLPFSRLRKRV